MTFLCFLTFTFWNSYVLKLLRLETITFIDVTLSDINVVWCYVLSQYRFVYYHRRSAYFCCRKFVDRSWEYINRSQTHECWNWDWAAQFPEKGMPKWDFVSVQLMTVFFCTGGEADSCTKPRKCGYFWPTSNSHRTWSQKKNFLSRSLLCYKE